MSLVSMSSHILSQQITHHRIQVLQNVSLDQNSVGCHKEFVYIYVYININNISHTHMCAHKHTYRDTHAYT